MSVHRLVCAVAARHEFHEEGLCRGLVFQPTEETHRHLRAEKLMLRTVPGELLLIGEAPITPDAPTLRFGLMAKDPQFGLYTELPRTARGEMPVLDNTKIEADEGGQERPLRRPAPGPCRRGGLRPLPRAAAPR